MGEGKDNMVSLTGTRRLADAVRSAKIAAAYRSDAAADVNEADRARLEILVDSLQSLIDEVPASDDHFDFSISGGQQPRFWIDATAHVTMGRDRRTYRFVRETRLGRVTLAESTEPRQIADRVTDYVADRIVEREKALAVNDGTGQRAARRAMAEREAASADAAPLRQATPPMARAASFANAFAWMMIGTVIGAGLLFFVASIRGFTVH